MCFQSWSLPTPPQEKAPHKEYNSGYHKVSDMQAQITQFFHKLGLQNTKNMMWAGEEVNWVPRITCGMHFLPNLNF